MIETDRPIPAPLVLPRRLLRYGRRAILVIRSLGVARLSRTTIVGPRCHVLSSDYFLTGTRVSIGADFHCSVNARIGDDVLISSAVSFVGNDHGFDGFSPITSGPRLPEDHIVLEGDNLIGYGTVILGSVCIGRGAIVGAGSLVLADVPAGAVAAGRPAQVLRARVGYEM